ncbi:hypothetical protein DIPPA_17110 [Diplonema papillatum]|nr:hypothetical protein DIPPA_17110 [Diplonema papillatum]
MSQSQEATFDIEQMDRVLAQFDEPASGGADDAMLLEELARGGDSQMVDVADALVEQMVTEVCGGAIDDGEGADDEDDDDDADAPPVALTLERPAEDRVADDDKSDTLSTASSSSEDMPSEPLMFPSMPNFENRIFALMNAVTTDGSGGVPATREAAKCMAAATELFLKEFGQHAMKHALRFNKKEIDYAHIQNLTRREPYEFLQPVFPPDNQMTLI